MTVAESKFEIGDLVKIAEVSWTHSWETLNQFGFTKDGVYEVSGVYAKGVISLKGAYTTYYPDYFELAEVKGVEKGIARPILTERKVGKVQMDLFDSGFPNAVMEVAKVMTWAAENKGYKPHDWVNLPDAETSFPSAASRHRVKSLIQKVEGLPVIERVDEESAILHKAHEAFNILAELELMLRGKIK